MEELKIRDVTTPWNSHLKMYYRDGLNDWNVIESCLTQDEYLFNKISASRKIGVDLGAHLGAASIGMASMGMKVYAVEALPENAKLIEDNAKLNNLSSLIKVYNRAIGANDTDILYAHYGDSTNENGRHHRYIGVVSAMPNIQEGVEIRVIKTISLDTIFRENNIQHCDILKTDCEGGEWPCFENASEETISKIDWILGELHPGFGHNADKLELMDLLWNKFEDVTPQFTNDPSFKNSHVMLHRKVK